MARIEQAKHPVIIAGVELHRYALQAEVVALAEATGIAMASPLPAKSVVSEVHPLFVGLYEGALGREEVTRFVEESDCIILLGTVRTDRELDEALTKALADTNGISLIRMHIGKDDRSLTLQRIGDGLARRLKR